MATIEKRGNGYRIVGSAGYDIHGKQIRKSKTWKPPQGLTARQIKKELERQAVLFDEEIAAGKTQSGNIKLETFIEQWFADYAAEHLRNLTIQRYRQLTKRIYPQLGHLRLDRIQPRHLVEFYIALGADETHTESGKTAKSDFKAVLSARNITYQKLSDLSGVSLRTVKAAASGATVSNKTAVALSTALGISVKDLFTVSGKDCHKLADKTIKHYHTFLSSVFERAVKWGMITDNPCRRVDAPKVSNKETVCLTVEQAAQFIEKLSAEPLEYQALFRTLLFTGMRRGEVMGLEWSDIDFDNNTITIKRTSQYTPEKGIYTDTTKTEQSKRTLYIPQELTELLQQYRREYIRRRLLLGDQWKDSDRLFIKWNGEPMHPNTPYSVLHKILKKNNLPIVSLHSLRHTNASIMIIGGTDIRTVSGRLGHSQTSTTLNIYAHLIQSADRAAADVVSNTLLKNA